MASDPAPRLSTVDPAAMQTPGTARRGLRWRRAVLAALLVVVVLGLGNAFGARQRLTVASGGGFEMEISHPAMTRAGLPVEWTVTVRAGGGATLPEQLRLVSDDGYFDLFDENGLSPTPIGEWRRGGAVEWVFDPPAGASELTVGLDARVQPDRHRGRSGRTAVIVDGEETVAVVYRTEVAP